MKIFIADTNVFIDLIKLGVLPDFFALSAEIFTTQFVTSEITIPIQQKEIDAFIRSRQLTVLELSGEEIEQMNNWVTIPRLKRIADRSVVWEAKKLQGIMLTGDKAMKEVAGVHSIETHGIFWIIERMLTEGIISESTAKTLHYEIKNINPWLR